MKSLMDHLGNFRCQIQEQKDLTRILIFLNKYKKNQIYNNLQTREEIEKLQKNKKKMISLTTNLKVKGQSKVSQVFRNQKINQMNRVLLKIEKSQFYKKIQFNNFLIQKVLTHLNLLIKYLE